MPGLIDAHVHIAYVEARRVDIESRNPGVTYAFAVARSIEGVLMHGFTTVRDAGNCDWSFKLAVERGLIKGPRLLISNGQISQTGGHGDRRERHDRTDPLPDHPIMPLPAIADGVDEVRRAARDQLRKGADQIKVMAGGGVGSPTSLLDTPQYTVEELAAAVYEASAVRKHVMAHVYVPEGIKNCVAAGVRSIEHGNFLDEESASLMKENGMYLVPTLSPFEILSRTKREGITAFHQEKFDRAKTAAVQGLEIAMSAGVTIASGSDIYGPNQFFKALELELKAMVMGPMKSIISATATNAQLLEMEKEIGTLEAGKLADLIVVDENPLDDIRVLQDANKITMVVQSGHIVKNSESI